MFNIGEKCRVRIFGVVFIVCQLLMVYLSFVAENSNDIVLLALISVLFTSMLVIGDVMFGIIFKKVLTRDNIEVEIAMQKMRVDTSKRFYEVVELQNKEIRRLYHDLTNHLLVLKEMENSGLNDEINRYSKNLEKTYNSKLTKKYTDNELVNIVITHYLNLFSGENLIVNFTIKMNQDNVTKYIGELIRVLDALLSLKYAGDIVIYDQQIFINEKVNIKDSYFRVQKISTGVVNHA